MKLRAISGIRNVPRQRFRKLLAHRDSLLQMRRVEPPQPVCQQGQHRVGTLPLDLLQPILLIQSSHFCDDALEIRSENLASAIEQPKHQRQRKQFQDRMRQHDACKFFPPLHRKRPLDRPHFAQQICIPHAQKSPSQGCHRLNRTEAEHRHIRLGMSRVVRSRKRLCAVFNHHKAALFRQFDHRSHRHTRAKKVRHHNRSGPLRNRQFDR